MKELALKYDPKIVESDKYDQWIDKQYFEAKNDEKPPFCLVIPPPNVTGKLHLGHAWDTTLQDIIARSKRMQGFDTLWVSGMDHAGIATQAKVDERLKKEGISRYDIGRDAFLKHAWDWKEEYAQTIRNQWAKMGLSLDYSRERFTLDEGLSKAVSKVFVDYYNAGLIYQGQRIINWDPQAKTALSNIEVIHKETQGAMYTFTYEIVETKQKLEVATTRPETMFGDVCVVVNPLDERYKNIIGMHAINPANQESLIIIGDDYIEIEFGTGAMKCTPAHDPNDYAIAQRHQLEKIICMNPDGTMNERALEFKGFDRFECRKALVKKIEAEGNLVKIEKYVHQVGYSERTNVIVEPYLSKQWFVKMKPLAADVLKAQEKDQDKMEFFPPRFEKTFTQWLENIEDWCISRQLWWGHRIPVWYHNETGELYVDVKPPVDIENYTQDEDVLDTWFSSALWPFSTLGWPEETVDFKRYYPNNVLVTGYDIIFFWVARMAFQARYFTASYPFKQVLIHGLIRDSQGHKMSKSLGNGIDPMDVIEQYGVDALRFFLTTNSTPGQDMRFMEDKVEASWNFINKLWNASRFVLMNKTDDFIMHNLSSLKLSSIDCWIIQRFNETIEHVNANMDKYEFALVGNELYSFIWNDFCSWYIELSKSGLNSDNSDTKLATQSTLISILQGIIKLLHPFIPFVTEEIYQAIGLDEKALCISAWPITIVGIEQSGNGEVEQLLSIIKAIREIKVDYQLKPSTPLTIFLQDSTNQPLLLSEETQMILFKMGKASSVSKIEGEVTVRPILAGSISVAMSELVNIEEEIIKLEKEKDRLVAEIERAKGMLANPNFVNKAPASKVEIEQDKLKDLLIQEKIVMDQLKELRK